MAIWWSLARPTDREMKAMPDTGSGGEPPLRWQLVELCVEATCVFRPRNQYAKGDLD